jgi:chromosome segregation ATPase
LIIHDPEVILSPSISLVSSPLIPLISELAALGNVQIQLVEQLTSYQSTITPPDYLKSDTTQLENDTEKLEDRLSELVNAQIKIEQSQTKITGSQTEIQAELKELNRLLDKLEK